MNLKRKYKHKNKKRFHNTERFRQLAVAQQAMVNKDVKNDN